MRIIGGFILLSAVVLFAGTTAMSDDPCADPPAWWLVIFSLAGLASIALSIMVLVQGKRDS